MTAKASQYRQQSQPRRGLRREEAAAYVGIGPTKFDELVSNGRMPHPFAIDGCTLWDIVDLDVAFEIEKARSRRRNPWDRDAA